MPYPNIRCNEFATAKGVASQIKLVWPAASHMQYLLKGAPGETGTPTARLVMSPRVLTLGLELKRRRRRINLLAGRNKGHMSVHTGRMREEERMKLHRRLCQSRQGASRAHACPPPPPCMQQGTKHVLQIESLCSQLHRASKALFGASHVKVQITCVPRGRGDRANTACLVVLWRTCSK